MLSEFRFMKWVKFFERNYIVKYMIFFASFCWFWDFLPKNLKLMNSKYEIFNHIFFWSKFCFLRTILEHFSQYIMPPSPPLPPPSYLKEILLPHVRKLVGSLLITSEGYCHAKTILQAKFGKLTVVANAHYL